VGSEKASSWSDGLCAACTVHCHSPKCTRAGLAKTDFDASITI
jgi:hypothetical protein